MVDFGPLRVKLNHMVEQKEELDLVFRALADPTRRAMLDRLRGGELSIVDLARPLQMTLAGAAKHVQVLGRANLILRRKDGRTQYCKLNHEALREACDWLSHYTEFWNDRLDNLEQILKQKQRQTRKKK